MLPVCICTPLKSVLRHKFSISVTYHPDTLQLREQECGDPRLLFETERSPRAKKSWETLNWGKSPVILLYCTYQHVVSTKKRYVLVHKSYDGRSHSLTTLTEVFPCFSSVVRQMPGLNSQSRGTDRISSELLSFVLCLSFCYAIVFMLFCCYYVVLLLCCSVIICVVLCIGCAYCTTATGC